MARPSWARAAARAAWREIAGWRSRPGQLLLLIVLPALSLAFFLALLGAGIPSQLPITVVDLDGSALSRRLARMLDASPTLRLTDMSSAAQAAHVVRSGGAYAVVTLPAGFERDVARGRAPTVVIDYNAQWLLPGSLIRRDARAAAVTLSASVETAVRAARGGPAAPVEPVRVDAHPLFNPQLNYGHFLLPALMPTMLQVFVLMYTVASFGGELRRGTARDWLSVADGRVSAAVAGKLAVPATWFTLAAAAMLFVVFRAWAVPMRGHWTLLLVSSAVFVIAYQAIGVMLAAWTANLRLATSFAAFYGGVAFAFVGVTFPLAGMPWTARAWAAALPLTHHLSLTFEQAMRGAPVAESITELRALTLFVVIPFAASLPRLATVIRDERYWGRL